MENVNIPELVIKSYEPKTVVAFLNMKLKKFNSGENANAELAMYIEILDALNKKMGGGSGKNIL